MPKIKPLAEEIRDTLVRDAERKVAGKPPKEVKADRKTGWRWRSESGVYGILVVTDDSGTSEYFVESVSLTRYKVTKLEADRKTEYTVQRPSKGNDKGHCGCEGFVRRQECRHVLALKALHEKGLL